MTKAVALIATLVVGALVAFQPPVNSQLARHTSVLAAALISTTVSAAIVAVLTALSGNLGNLRGAGGGYWLYLGGGAIGAALVCVSLVTVRRLGAGGVVAATVSSQLITSAILDHFGVLGLARVALSPVRVAGVALLVAGTFLVTFYR
jgi:transporter family-2 protein